MSATKTKETPTKPAKETTSKPAAKKPSHPTYKGQYKITRAVFNCRFDEIIY